MKNAVPSKIETLNVKIWQRKLKDKTNVFRQ